MHKKPSAILTSLRNAFLAGIVLLTPLAVTLYVINILVSNIGGQFRDHFFFYIPEEMLGRRGLVALWNIAATLKVIILVTLLGYFSRYLIAKYFVNLSEKIITSFPFVKTVYNSVKQIVQTFSMQQEAIFQKVVMLEYPRKGTWAIGFLTSRAKGEPQARTSDDLCNVFVPTTPNPTSGFLLMVPWKDVIELEMNVGDGMKLIISGGAVVPKYQDQKEITAVRTEEHSHISARQPARSNRKTRH